ncbi:hypothetical protein EDB92DRAFT_1896540 [Lactarius akahatsu]|uniref:Uncharacterized protein n=1 Tax=Lactarius akahatsu TaxID=416441 RepID=A0AAD4L7S9_9AGAM|nr:hypothetical protein EDB92DRAFT_1896540 [Lactarius akahatsu]
MGGRTAEVDYSTHSTVDNGLRSVMRRVMAPYGARTSPQTGPLRMAWASPRAFSGLESRCIAFDVNHRVCINASALFTRRCFSLISLDTANSVGNPIESTPPHHRRYAQSQRYSKAKASHPTYHLSALAVASRLERKGVRRWGRCRFSWPGRRVYGDNFPVPDIFVELHWEQRHDDTVESMRASRNKPFGPGGGSADHTLAQESFCNHRVPTLESRTAGMGQGHTLGVITLSPEPAFQSTRHGRTGCASYTAAIFYYMSGVTVTTKVTTSDEGDFHYISSMEMVYILPSRLTNVTAHASLPV